MEVLRDIYLQLKNVTENGQTILVPGIDGVPLTFQVFEPGHVPKDYSSQPSGLESAVYSPLFSSQVTLVSSAALTGTSSNLHDTQ